MDLGLKDKSTLVMASSSGLGKAIALELAREGANVMLFSPDLEGLKQAQAEIEKETGKKPAYVCGSSTNYEDIKAVVKKTVELYGPIYALMNNTGGPKPGEFDSFNDADWQNAYELCLLSYIRTNREVLPYMRQNGGGRIGTARIEYLDQVRAEKAHTTVEDIQKKAFANIPLGRYGKPEEYGKMAAFLLSATNTFITGQTVLCDGGMVKAF